MKKRGFTLVELLAVIVILAIIAVIATPIILGVIEKSKKGAAENSALGYTEAVEKQIARNLLDEDAENDIKGGIHEVNDLTSKKVKVKGDAPSKGWVEIEKKQVVNYSLKIGEYVVTYNNKNIETTKSEQVATKPSRTYYAYGTPTTESTTDPTTLGKKVFAFLGSDDSTGVCINDNGVFCIKAKDYENTVASLKAHFGETSCGVYGSYFACHPPYFSCDASSDGDVSCNDNSADDACHAYADGSFSCR